MNKEFRYVIRGHACNWQKQESMPVAQLNYNAMRLNAWYGDDWQIEYR